MIKRLFPPHRLIGEKHAKLTCGQRDGRAKGKRAAPDVNAGMNVQRNGIESNGNV